MDTRQRKKLEDERFEQRVYESTTEHRLQMRLMRSIRERLNAEAQQILPHILLCAFTQRLLQQLQHHWNLQRLQLRIRGIVRFWRQKRSERSMNAQAAIILVHWLQKSVTVKSVGFRVFQGVRLYLRRTKQLQLLWRQKCAKRRLQFLLVQRIWIECETQLVDAATEAFEQRLARVSDSRV